MAKKRPKPTPPGSVPAIIADDPVAVSEFIAKRKLLIEADLMQNCDDESLALYARCYSDYRREKKLLDKEGSILIGEKGTPFPNPRSWLAKQALDAMTRLLASFGLTPVSRARTKLVASRSTTPGKGFLEMFTKHNAARESLDPDYRANGERIRAEARAWTPPDYVDPDSDD